MRHSWLILRYYRSIILEWLSRNTKTVVMIVGTLAEFRTEHVQYIPYMRKELSYLNNLLSGK